jgi:hypothetical protein
MWKKVQFDNFYPLIKKLLVTIYQIDFFSTSAYTYWFKEQ